MPFLSFLKTSFKSEPSSKGSKPRPRESGGARRREEAGAPLERLGSSCSSAPRTPASGGGDDRCFRFHSILYSRPMVKVHLVSKDDDGGSLHALKVVDKAQLLAQSHTSFLMVESEALRRADHPFVVKLESCFQTTEKLFFLLEYVSEGNLETLLERVPGGRLPEASARTVAAEVFLGLEHLHNQGIIFRDLQPRNILIHSDGHIRLTSFAYSKVFPRSNLNAEDQRCNSVVGSLMHVAPEVLRQRMYSRSVDLWSLGVVLFELLSGAMPFEGRSWDEVFRSIVTSEPTYDKFPWLSSDARDMLRGLLQKSERRRLTAAQIREQPFFESLSWAALLTRADDGPLRAHLIPSSSQTSLDSNPASVTSPARSDSSTSSSSSSASLGSPTAATSGSAPSTPQSAQGPGLPMSVSSCSRRAPGHSSLSEEDQAMFKDFTWEPAKQDQSFHVDDLSLFV